MKGKFVFFLALLGLVSCNRSLNNSTTDSTETTNATESQTASAASLDVSELLGVWDISINTPRGTRSNALTLYEDDGQLKGKTDNGNFTIRQDGDQLTWSSNIESPMGSLNAKHKVTIKENTMSGTVNAGGRTIQMTGQKRL